MTPRCTAGKSIEILFFPRMTALEIVFCAVMLPFMVLLWILVKTAQGLFAAGRWVKGLCARRRLICPIDDDSDDEKPCAESTDCCFWPNGCSEVKR